MRMTRRGWAAAPALLALAVAGCRGGSTTTPAGDQIETAPPPKPAKAGTDTTQTQAPPADPAAVQLTQVSVADWEKAIAAQKGKVVLVDVWFYG